MPVKKLVATAMGNPFSALDEAPEEVNAPAAAARPQSSSSSKLKEPLVWIDLEMTGLDTNLHTIIEIAVILTDGELDRRIEGPAIAVHHSDEVLSGMNEWCVEHHGKSGLTQRCKDSTIDLKEAEQQVLAFIKQHIPDEGKGILAGNSIHVDRMFLCKYMPDLIAHLHYRIVDVSTVKELAKRWFPSASRRAPKKVLAHTALSDVRESIEELQYYRKAVFLSGGKGK
jgi:oligoribonuclease